MERPQTQFYSTPAQPHIDVSKVARAKTVSIPPYHMTFSATACPLLLLTYFSNHKVIKG